MKFTRRKNGLMMANRIITVVLAEDAVRWVAEHTGWSMEKCADEMLNLIIAHGSPQYQDYQWIVEDPQTSVASLVAGHIDDYEYAAAVVAYPGESGSALGMYVGRIK
jgi:hypothetical protein